MRWPMARNTFMSQSVSPEISRSHIRCSRQCGQHHWGHGRRVPFGPCNRSAFTRSRPAGMSWALDGRESKMRGNKPGVTMPLEGRECWRVLTTIQRSAGARPACLFIRMEGIGNDTSFTHPSQGFFPSRGVAGSIYMHSHDPQAALLIPAGSHLGTGVRASCRR